MRFCARLSTSGLQGSELGLTSFVDCGEADSIGRVDSEPANGNQPAPGNEDQSGHLAIPALNPDLLVPTDSN